MSYTAWSVVYGEQPTAAKWNQLGSNDAGFKDGTNIDSSAITTAKIADDAVTAAKLADFAAAANLVVVGTEETGGAGTTTATSFTPTLSGAGTISVAAVIGSSGQALVNLSAWMQDSGGACVMSFAVSGATTVAATNARGITVPSNASSFGLGRTVRITGLNAGSNTFTLNHFVTAGTGSFNNRQISVIPL